MGGVPEWNGLAFVVHQGNKCPHLWLNFIFPKDLAQVLCDPDSGLVEPPLGSEIDNLLKIDYTIMP